MPSIGVQARVPPSLAVPARRRPFISGRIAQYFWFAVCIFGAVASVKSDVTGFNKNARDDQVWMKPRGVVEVSKFAAGPWESIVRRDPLPPRTKGVNGEGREQGELCA